MAMLRAALLQLNSSDDPAENLPVTLKMIREAAAGGADFVLTPEVTNCVSESRARQREVLQCEAEDITLAALRGEALRLGITILIGSLALRTDDPDGRFANRSFLIGPDGRIIARYDKIHMFDVDLGGAENFRESAGFRPGDRAVIGDAPFGRVGLTICYDVRFPHLHRALAKGGAAILTAPAAFSPVSGAAHWHVLQRARAIENGCFVLAPAQCGLHRARAGRARRTYGHSLAVSPWGEILIDGGEKPGIFPVDLDLGEVEECRRKIPSLLHDRPFRGPGDE